MNPKIAGLIIATLGANQTFPTIDNNLTGEALAAASMMKITGKVVNFPLGSPKMEEIPSMIVLTKPGDTISEEKWSQTISMTEWVSKYKEFYSLKTTMEFLVHLAGKTLEMSDEFVAGLKEIKLFIGGGIKDNWTALELASILNDTIPFIALDRDTEGVVSQVVRDMILGVEIYGAGSTTFGVAIVTKRDLLSVEAAKNFAVENNLVIVTGTREFQSRTIVILPGNKFFTEEFERQTGFPTETVEGVAVSVDVNGTVLDPTVITDHVSSVVGQLNNAEVEYTTVETPETIRTLFKAVKTEEVAEATA